MGPQSSGYSWTSTSQWSQLPTVPVDNTTGTATPSTAPQQQTSYQPQQQTQNTGYTQPSSSMTPPETRRDMVTRLYRRVLGREPDAAGLNYYLFNSQISELQIAREMYESTEHQDYLKKAKDIREMIIKLEKNDARVKEMEAKLLNAENLAKNYKLLVDQKTQIINELRSQTGDVISNEHVNVAPQTQPEHIQVTQSHYQPYDQYEEGVLLNDPFADDYQAKGKGCMGIFKRWISFN